MDKKYTKNVGFYESRNGGTFTVNLDGYTLECLKDLIRAAEADFNSNAVDQGDRKVAGRILFTRIPEGRNTKFTHSMGYIDRKTVEENNRKYKETQSDSI